MDCTLPRTLLRSSTQHPRKRGRRAPHRFHPRIVLQPSLHAHQTLSVLGLGLLESQQVALEAPDIVSRGERQALWIHAAFAAYSVSVFPPDLGEADC